MTVTLTPELERRLADEAARHGMTAEQYARSLIERSLAPERAESALAALLRSWAEEDATEAPTADDSLFRAIDEDRPSDRKLFPPELRGTTW